MRCQVFHGDCAEVMKSFKDNTFDSIVTDPPYGLEFMGKEWDSFGRTREYTERDGYKNKGVLSHYGRGGRSKDVDRFKRRANHEFQAWCEMWARECFRVLKPGGHLLAFGGTRTYHRLACGVEDAGFEVRDSLHWIYGSGFPKSKNLDGDWQGWGTALKPAHEPIIVARSPLAEETVAANVQVYGTGGLNINGCRVDRWPSNVLLDGEFPVFCYQAKASKKERPQGNVAHPTVKPLKLMQWLVKLVTPPDGLVLDPFAGTGTTGEACLEEGFRCILIERDPDYIKLIQTRFDRRQPTLWDAA